MSAATDLWQRAAEDETPSESEHALGERDLTPTELTPVEHEWFAVHDERSAPRRDVALECTVVATWDDARTFELCDLSPFGAFILMREPLARGQALVVSFTPPGWDFELEVFAEVVRVDPLGRPGGGGVAVAFSGLTTSEHFLLTDALLTAPAGSA
ncbi:MAG: PilZ domain-containing protein [Polyangiaceae bacterium]|nr:PilZ domain-containing protein [Polyangiaceae bacterium]